MNRAGWALSGLLFFLILTPSRGDNGDNQLRLLPLPPPPQQLLQPLDREIILKPIAEREFRWTPTEEAVIYHLEISTDPGFRVLILDAYPTDNFFTIKELPEGTFYWHVSSISAAGLEGRFGPEFSFFYPRRGR